MKDFVLSVCSHRGVSPITASCIEFAHQELGNNFIIRYDSGDAWLDRMRSVAATQFMEHDWADYMIFLDDDIVFNPHHLAKLFQDMKEGYRLVGGLYPVRNGSQLASYGIEDKGGIRLDGKVNEIKWLATGFMGIAKSLLKEMVEHYELPRLQQGQWCECFPFFVFTSDKKMLWSEDWSFCERAREMGEKVYADTSILLGHIGDKVYTCADAVEATRRKEHLERRRRGILNPGDAKVALEGVCGVLEDLGARHWIDSGTLLSAVRDNDFNIYDHDIDVRCFKDDISDEAMPKLIDSLYNAGYRTFQQNVGERRQLLCIHENGVMLDLKFCEHDDRYLWYYVWDTTPGGSIHPDALVVAHCFERRYFDKLGEREFYGRKYPVPSPEIEYLNQHYGEKWREFKTKPEEVDQTDLTWDSQHDPPCVMSLEALAQLRAADSAAVKSKNKTEVKLNESKRKRV